ncbi:MAG TPA: hypothetical protein VLE70_21690 [Anaerolineae bacterium]|jgi:hypothetical protein|nr:hypothetical protein [Anaerolineae bacterium]
MMDQEMVSFVLRFVREAGEEQQARWRGVVKHVQSNTETSFSQFSEALAFMQGYVNEVAQASFEESRHMGEGFAEANEYAANAFGANPFASRALAETTRLWGGYTKMMMDSVGEAMASGAGMTKPMEEMMNATLSAWGMSPPAAQPEQSDQENTAGAAEAMAARIDALNDKIAALEKQIAELNEDSEQSKG